MDTIETKPEPKKTAAQKAFFLLRVLEIRLRFVAVLVITALVVGYWDNIQNYWERWTRPAPQAGAQAVSDIEYTCAMHPFVVRDAPGKCPICGMDLIQRKKGASVALPEGTLARVQISPERIMQAGVQVEPVAYRLLSRTMRSYGLVELDETQTARITLRFPGRIDELMVDAVGMEVKKGDPLARVYSPKFLAISQEYIQAVETQHKTEADPQASADTKQFSASIVENTRRRLRLAGFTTEQLDKLAQGGKPDDHVTFYSPLSGTVIEKNVLLGDTLEEGMTLYTVADLSRLWVQVQVMEADLAAVKLGMPVEVTSVAWPGEIFRGNVDLLYPTLNVENRSMKARLSVLNKKAKLRPGMYVNAVLRSPLGRYGEIGTPNEPKPDSSELHPKNTQITEDVYTCPMHPEVTSAMPGACPKCGMQLVKKPKADASQQALTERWVEGYTCPMHPDMLQPEGGVCMTCGCGMQTVKWRLERVLSIPETAVIDTGTRYVVYVQTMPGVYDARAVTLGSRAGIYYPVLGGLKLGENIVSRGSFLIDAEARLNPAATVGGENAEGAGH